MKILITGIVMLSISAHAQIDTLVDPYGLSYKDVFDNMHYNQTYRPQVHYTPISGEIGDATGLLRYKGEYHLFYMYDEWSRRRKFNKSWGHATSYDCIFWEQKPQILNTVIDNRPGSGSGVVDWNNTLGLQSGLEKTMVVFYTDYERGTCIAFSRDAGKTWIRHKANPVIPMPEGRADRDAFVFWYKPDQSWRMILYEPPGFTFYKSVDLLNWVFLSKLDGFHECPDFMEIPVDGKENNKKWVIIDGNGTYRTGTFTGTKLIPEIGNTKVDYGNLYATQTFKQSYEGEGPFIQLAFLRIQDQSERELTWSKQLTFPCALSLKTINGEVRLCRNPIIEIKQLRYDAHFWKEIVVESGENPFADLKGDVFEIITEIDLSKSDGFWLNLRGEKLSYTSKEQQMTFMGNQARVVPVGHKIKLRLIIDRSSIEIFANEGEVTFSNLFYPDPSNMNMELSPIGGSLKVNYMEAYRLTPIWLKREQALGYYRESFEK
ncbi:MAG: glycoside hydrolase family 32 protein [Cyclobacteriaceae bacterium]|nr:glycoside hydrolase family 32 protein [Cyclobacteriaceae bacterium]